jgi:predicted secreted protein
MNWFSGIVVYLLIWWVVLFTVLPWKSRPPRHPRTGHATSAPKAPNLGVKFVATSVIAGFLWLVVYLLIDQGFIDYRAIAMHMMREDNAL